MKNIRPGMWMVLSDKCAEGNVMVRVMAVNEVSKTATVYMDLAAKKNDEARPYVTEVDFEFLQMPTIKIKKNKKHIEK